ncbi:hypothetical protein BGZ96_006765 [Linnemannia gamsii]|uniref:Transcription activator GCR1-like domain-containing protein n=1 Tax=Linnemannia gamsii TaxID=64522 RepID=A0ABQ7K1W9_9FUNG|nr:hypothetical protein BGZ96_006765 [Linnemannia gamsii]
MFRYDSLERGIAGGNRQDSSVWENTARQSAISNREGTRRSDSWEDDRLSSRRDGGDLTQSDERANDHHNNLERTQTRHEDRVDTRYKSRGRDQERRRGATHDDWQGHRRIRSASVLKPDQESDSQVDSRPLSSWEAAYHQGLEEGRRSSREVLPYSDERKDTRANSREDPGFDSRQVQRQDRRSSLRDDARAPSRQGGHRSDPRYDDSDDAPHGGRQDLPLLERYSGLAGLRPSSRASPRREYPLDPLEPVRKSASQEQQSSSRQEDAQVQMRLSHQDDQEDQWKSGRQKARQEDHQDSRDVCLPKEANSPVLPSKLLYGEVKLSRSNSKVYGTHGMDEDDFPPAFEGNDRADDVQDLADDSDYDEPEESLMSKLTRRRRLSQHNFTSATPSGSSLSIPVSTAITASTTASTANPACGENVVYVSTKDSSPAYSFTLGRYKANEFIIHSPQHKDGPFTNKTRPIPESCHNVIDVLEVWRYGKKPFTAIQDLSEKYGRSWIAQNDKERHHFFTEVVQEFRRLVLDQGMHDDMAVKELMGRQEWWLIPLSNPPQADEAGELSSEGEPMDTDSNSDYVFRSSYQRKSSESRKSSRSLKRSESSKRSQSRKRSESRKASQSHKKSPAISTDMDMDMDMDISTAEANRTTAADHSASSDEDAEPMDFEAFDASIARPVSRNSHRHPRPQYKDNFVEPWGDAPINYSFTFPIPDGIETVPEIYQAWYYGWKDLPALLQLTKDNGPSWRSSLLPSSKKVYDWYHVHYKVVRAIDDQVAMEPSEWTVEDAILSLEQLRGKKKLSNLHKDIPRPGHMIKPIKSKDIGTPKGHAEDGSPAAYDDIKPTTSNSKAPPTDNSTLTAGDSPPNSSITGSSESLITDQSAGIIATNVSSSSKTSATSQPRLTTDNNTPTTIKDKPLPTSPRNSIGAFVEKKFKFFRNNALGAKGKTTGSAKTSSTDNTTANRRKSTTDITSSTSSAKDRMATSTPTRTIDDIADSISKLIDEGTNATTASIARLTTESNSVPMTKESTAAGSMTKIAESTIIGGPKSTVDNGDAPGAMDGITTSVLMNAVNNSDVASKSTPAAEINNASVDKDKTSDISVASTVNDTTASTPPTSMAKSIPLSTKDWTVSMDDAVVNNSDVSKAKLAVDSSSVSITKVRSSSVAASTSATKNVAVSRSISSGSSYTFIHKSTFQRAMSNTQIGSRTSKEQPKGLIQSGSAPTSSSGTPISRSSFDEDAVMSSSARTGDNRPSGMPTSNSNNSTTALNGMNTGNANCLLNDVTAGAVNRPNTVSVSSDVKNVPSGMIAGTARPLNSHTSHFVTPRICFISRSSATATWSAVLKGSAPDFVFVVLRVLPTG